MAVEQVQGALEQVARPLLQLMRRISGLETTFVTRIDWADQRQEVVVALNTSPGLQVAERSVVDWEDSMCRWVFLSGKEQSTDVRGDFPGSLGAEQLGMQTFFAVPIFGQGDEVVGTVCGASRDVIPVSEHTLGLMRLVSQAMAGQVQAQVALRQQTARAEDAELEAEAVRIQAADIANTAEVMQKLAFTDTLTELANRRGFMTRYETQLAQSGRHDFPIALLRIDVDNFKQVNDSAGHATGDRVLAVLGEILRRVSRAADVAARPGGDEFALVIPYSDVEGAVAVAERIRAEFRAAVPGVGRPVTVSIGISSSLLTPRRQLLEAADRALYQAKADGRDRYHVWREGVETAASG